MNLDQAFKYYQDHKMGYWEFLGIVESHGWADFGVTEENKLVLFKKELIVGRISSLVAQCLKKSCMN